MGMGSEFGKIEDRDRVSLEGEMKGNEANKNSPKISGGRVICWLQSTCEIW